MKKPEIKDAGAEYAEIWGEAIHTNRHLRMISGGLAIASAVAHRRRHSALSRSNRRDPSL